MIAQEIVDDALRSGNYKQKTVWTEMYLRFRQENIYLYVRKELADEIIEETIELLKTLDFSVWDFNIKKAVGAYLLSLICVKPVHNFYVANDSQEVKYKKV